MKNYFFLSIFCILSFNCSQLEKNQECPGFVDDYNEAITYLPSLEKQQQQIKPIYEVLDGWDGSIVGIRKIEDLPNQAKSYVKRIEKLIGCEIILISTSPEREDTILIENPFEI